jgi:hypothetical protein
MKDYSALHASPLRGRPAGDRHRRCAALSSNRLVFRRGFEWMIRSRIVAPGVADNF